MRPHLSLAALLLAALAVRLCAAAWGGVYVDEAYTWYISRATLHDILTGTRPDLNPPAWYLLIKPLALATGEALLLRLPSVLCGTLAVAAVYLAGRSLRGEALGVAAGALAALAYPIWLVDAQMRAYGVVSLLAATALWVSLTREPVRWRWGAYAASCVLLPVLHYIGVLVDAALLVAALVGRERRRALWVPPLVGFAAAACWLAFALSGQTTELAPKVREAAVPWDVLDAPAYLTGILAPFFWQPLREALGLDGRLLYNFSRVLSLLLWGCAAWGFVDLARRSRVQAATVGVFFALPLAGIMAGAFVGVQSYQQRYLDPVAAGFFLLLAAGLLALRLKAVVALVLCANLLVASVYPRTPFFWNQDWGAVSRFVTERQRPGDVLAAYVPYSMIGFAFAYDRTGCDVDFSTPGQVAVRVNASYRGIPLVAVTPSSLDGAELGGRRVFLVLNQEDAAGGQRVRAWFGSRYGILDELAIDGLHSWGDTTVYLLAPLPGR